MSKRCNECERLKKEYKVLVNENKRLQLELDKVKEANEDLLDLYNFYKVKEEPSIPWSQVKRKLCIS